MLVLKTLKKRKWESPVPCVYAIDFIKPILSYSLANYIQFIKVTNNFIV